MLFLIAFICSALACYLLRPLIHKYPTVFYAISFVITGIYLAHVTGVITLPRQIWLVFFEMIQECTLALALFMVVMYIGVFKASSTFGSKLRSIRGEVSIVAWILTLGHVVFYFVSMLPQVTGQSGTSVNIYVSFFVAIVLLVLLMLLGITSFKFVKKRMSTEAWSRVQKLSYVFIALIYVHLMLLLLPSALSGGIAAQQSVAVYTVVFCAYAIGRIVRWRIDAKGKAEEAA